MQIMFNMMNEARLATGFMGLVYASNAYLYAVNYARERLQGRDMAAKEPDAPQVPIIRHPDVRRMLLWMKAHLDGMRSLIHYIGKLLDLMACDEKKEDWEKYDDLASLLTPVVKAYCAERGFDICVQSIQVHGLKSRVLVQTGYVAIAHVVGKYVDQVGSVVHRLSLSGGSVYLFDVRPLDRHRIGSR